MTDMTTSPISAPKSPAEIDAVFGDGTTKDPALAPSQTAREEWRRFARYVKRPVLPDAMARRSDAVSGTLRMLGLDLAIMTVFIGTLMLIVAAGFDLPENLNSTLDMNMTTVLLVVVLAPLLEEAVFRSWLSGRPRYLGAFAALLAAGVIAAIAGASVGGDTGTAIGGLAVLAGLVAAVVAMVLLWKRQPPGWFRTAFPVLFWLSSLAFSLVHLMNYTEGALYVLLPLVIPQLILGTMAAYVRVQFGLIFAILLHALHNGFALSLAALAMSAGMES